MHMNGAYHVEYYGGVIWAKSEAPTLERNEEAKHYL